MPHRASVRAGSGNDRAFFSSTRRLFQPFAVAFEKTSEAFNRMGRRKKNRRIALVVAGALLEAQLGVRDDNMGVGATEAERIDTGKTRTIALFEQDRLIRNLNVQILKVDVLVRLFEMQRRRKIVVLQRKHRLDHAKKTGGRFGMADVRLDRSDRDWLAP
ncbi:MAG: hypothetical protein QMD99_03090, partial [Rhizobiaceae bacterium]|nr:hypothetical protein [Rhizobiaceae bacterium]